MLQAQYQLIIVGGGPAGLTAGLYAARGRLKTLLVEKGATGGQVLVTDWVDNFPGFVEGVSGFDLMDKMTAHADRFGLEKKFAVIKSLDLAGEIKTVTLENGESLTASTIILCTGARPRRLGVAGEFELSGRGVSYCATCDANFFRDMDVAVVGGGDTALEEAAYLTKFAKKVTLIHRRDEFRGAKILQERIKKNPKIEILYDSTVDSIQSGPDGLVDKIEVRNLISGKVEDLPVQGIFIFVGHIPNTRFLEGKVRLTGSGYIPTSDRMETNVPGVYAAGDVREKELRQIVTATADGAIAAVNAVKYVEEFE